MIFSYKGAPETAPRFDEFSILQAFRGLGTVMNRIMSGKVNATGEVTLAAGGTTTTVTDARATAGSYIGFDPLTANAAAEKAAGTIYVLDANRRNGSFVITHANNAQTDRTFKYLLIG